MRGLMLDKLARSELVVFNRARGREQRRRPAGAAQAGAPGLPQSAISPMSLRTAV